ncbi:MAG: hypothetical protein COB93_03680 [Sneathiella sp.]|nr:MAG: hypothetical protein COB93_03680 [Sneathiella sp.]
MSLRYFPLETTDYRLTMGLKALKDRSWLEVDTNYSQDIAEKQRLLAAHPDSVYGETDGTYAAQRHILELVQTELTNFRTDISKRSLHPTEPPLIAAAKLVQEDLVLMRKQGTDYVLAAACVCFPTGWNLIEKVGQTIRHIHRPVPGLNNQIGMSIDKFFDRLKPGRIVERFNWGLYDSAALFQAGWWRAERPVNRAISPENIGEKIHFRVERQTLQRLADTPDILFSIRIFNTPLAEVVETPERAAQLDHALRTMPKDMLEYKSIRRYEGLIQDYVSQASR